MLTIREILVPTDFSEPANAALAYAKALATQFGSRLHLLNVVATPHFGWAAESTTPSWPTLLADLEADARAQLNWQVPPGDPLAGRVFMATAIGVPVERILEYAKANQIDLIVMGTHGRDMVEHMFLGSVAERVVRRSPVPVVTMHAAPVRRAADTADRAVQAEEQPGIATATR
jgi:nucleotide-binding universal stress UspA family protein